MADESDNKEENGEGEESSADDSSDFGALTGDGESTLGNLPPLSDFDSAESDSGLPPLGGIDSDPIVETPSTGGLPPIDEINVETPDPTGGSIRPAPPEFGDESAFDTPSTESKLDTPEPLSDTPEPLSDTPHPLGAGDSFQDLAADSDFSPETPEIGPGPDSDIDTPMFDSAFGGADDSSFGDIIDTPAPAPTQAMETPMFETGDVAGAESLGFEDDAFSTGAADTGTPVPDFSPDTAIPGIEAIAQPETEGGVPTKGRGGVGGVKLIGMLVGLLVLGLGAGVFLGPMIMSNPLTGELEEERQKVAGLESTITRMDRGAVGGASAPSVEDINRRIDTKNQLDSEIQTMEAERNSVTNDLGEAERSLSLIQDDIESKNEEFVNAQEDLEELQNQMALTRAQHDGLEAENRRLTDQVGNLESANIRRVATKETLKHDVDLLMVQIREGIPLTPNKFSRADRLARIEELKAKVSAANWVSPALLDEYTQLYLLELAISESTEYFFAKIPVKDRLGIVYHRWAECLMNGSKSVYYQTINGKNVGIYQNMNAEVGPRQYAFVEELPQKQRQEIVEIIESARIEDFDEKVAILEGKQALVETGRGIRRTFGSL